MRRNNHRSTAFLAILHPLLKNSREKTIESEYQELTKIIQPLSESIFLATILTIAYTLLTHDLIPLPLSNIQVLYVHDRS